MEPELEALFQRLVARTDYERCVRPRAARWSNEAAAALLDRLDRPQDASPALHVAGSKGKGSTALFLAAGLALSGRRVGVYSSPHLSDWRERAQILPAGRGEAAFVPDAEWATAMRRVLEQSRGHETFFDLLTAVAFQIFSQVGCDAQVIEVGLGGRADSTRVLRPVAALVTSIEREHAEILGPGLDRIAWNKAGIFVPGARCWAGSGLPDAARAVLEAEARALDTVLRIAPARHPSGRVPDAWLAHQARNHALAGAVLHDVDAVLPGAAAAFDGLDPAGVRLPGRYETRWAGDGRPVVLDVAHSENSLAEVLERFRHEYDGWSRGVVLALRDDKDAAALASALEARLGPRPEGERWWAAPAGDHPRSARPDALAPVFGCDVLAEPALPDGPQALLVTGSTYLVGALRPTTHTEPPR